MIAFDLLLKNDILEFKKYLKYGNIMVLDDEKNSLLGKAVSLVRFDFVMILLEHLNIDHQNKNGDSIMHLAIRTNNLEMVKLISRYPYDANIKNKNNLDIIELAIYQANYLIFKALYKSTTRPSDLIIASKYFEKRIFKSVYETNSKYINIEDESKQTLLHIATLTNNYYLVEFLLHKKIKYYKKDKNKETAMFNAFRYCSSKIIKKLMDYLPLNSVNIFDEKIIDFASEENKYLFKLKTKHNFLFSVINENKKEMIRYSNSITEKIKNQAKNILLEYNNQELLDVLYVI